MPNRTATKSTTRPSKPRATPPKPSSKTQARKEDSPNLEVRAEATPLPVDKAHEEAERQRAELQQPGQVRKDSKAAEQIDNDPGYDKDQLAHMREYWGDEERDEPGK